jgi:hypothetical protein
VTHHPNKPSTKEQVRFFGFTLLIALIIILLYSLGVSNNILGWIAFCVAAYSVAGNDAIQTIGTFIESKKGKGLPLKIAVFCGLLFTVHFIGWMRDSGEIHFHRLDAFPPPEQFNLVQLLAPCVIVILTRLKAPISTTFLILGLFGGSNIEKMLTKSFLGYGIAFFSAMLVWGLHSIFQSKEYKEDFEPDPKTEKFWAGFQWVSTSLLWVSWLLQDTANIAVFIPRQLQFWEFCVGMGIIGLALAFILYSDGGTIQEVVSEKSDINSAKAATIVDLVYAAVLIIFQQWSKMPMSTTWVFLGLLAGREIILHIVTRKDRPYLETFRQVGKDVLLASLGITVSLSIYVLSSILYPKEKKSSGVLIENPIPKIEFTRNKD